MKRLLTTLTAGAVLAVLTLSACQTKPSTSAERRELLESADSRIAMYRELDPGIDQFFDTSYGYAVFPTVGSGAFVIGGGFGRGIVYEQNEAIGFADITQGSIGLQAGGQGFSQIVFFQTKENLDQFTEGRFTFAADVGAVAIESGAAAQTNFVNGVAVFIQSQSGLMASAAVGGQRFNFVPYAGSSFVASGPEDEQR